MANPLQGRRIAILAADGVERVELEVPRDDVLQAGARTDLLSLQNGEIQARNNDLEEAGTFEVDRAVSDASVNDYDAVLLPGGTVNPDNFESTNVRSRLSATSYGQVSRSALSVTAPGPS